MRAALAALAGFQPFPGLEPAGAGALSVRLAIEPSEPLITSAPATAGAPPTLF